MAPRDDLQTLLETIAPHVYFQPPIDLNIEYPCIIYALEARKSEFADNKPYHNTKRYAVTIIDRDPDSEIPDQVAGLPMNTFNRFFTANGLNHHVYDLYF